ncbi:hypothetical protein [Sporisorium scitamineum]|uniref:Uncharacterized protein n=1 Tax=Sporisorium scitamineum TaxID=49012 RepID=A0A0F7S8Q0_9BASI|nr:hypothetical protein [Sporisorium scitamineum]
MLWLQRDFDAKTPRMAEQQIKIGIASHATVYGLSSPSSVPDGPVDRQRSDTLCEAPAEEDCS